MENKSNLKYRIYRYLFLLYVLACIAGGVYIAMKSQADYEAKQAALQADSVAEDQKDTQPSEVTLNTGEAKSITPVDETPKNVPEKEKTQNASAFPPQVPSLNVVEKKESMKVPEKSKLDEKKRVVKKEESSSLKSDEESIAMNLHRKIVEKLQQKIKKQEITIKDLKKTVDSLKRNMKSDLAKLKKPVSKFVAECYGMEIGDWNVDSQCIRQAQKTIGKMAEKYPGIIAWEVLPVVDSRPYKGLSPELKQEGLASFRAQAGIKLINKTLKKEVVAFKGMTIREDVKRGFIIKVHYLK